MARKQTEADMKKHVMPPKRKMKSKPDLSKQHGDEAKKPRMEHFPLESGRYQNIREKMEKRHKEKVKKAFMELSQKFKKRTKSKEDPIQEWCQTHATELHPGMCKIAYAVPYFFISKHKTEESKKVEGVLRRKLQESDIRGDNAQRKVGRAFRMLNNKFELEGRTTMFIAGNVMYEHLFICHRKGEEFLKPEHALYTDVLAEKFYTHPEKQRHEVDLIVFHEKKGVIFVQVKAVGLFPDAPTSKKGGKGGNQDRINKAIKKQLQMDIDVFKLVMGHHGKVSRHVTKVLALPNLKRKHVIDLGIKEEDIKDIHFLFEGALFDDDIKLSESELNLETFRCWWDQLPDHRISIEFIQDAVARYVGVLSSPLAVDDSSEPSHVRDVSCAICLAGRLLKSLVLTEQQETLLTSETPPRVYLTGPPGSGKTTMLCRKGVDFAKKDDRNHVIVVDVFPGATGRAIGKHIYNTLRAAGQQSASEGATAAQATAREGATTRQRTGTQSSEPSSGGGQKGTQGTRQQPGKGKQSKSQQEPQASTSTQSSVDFEGRIHYLSIDVHAKKLNFVKKVEEEVSGSVNLLFVFDEVIFSQDWERLMDLFHKTELLKGSQVWCAAALVSPKINSMHDFKQEELKVSHRCAPAVQNVMYHADWDEERKLMYRSDAKDMPEVATNGPTAISIRHERHGPHLVRDCTQCADELAALLQDKDKLNLIKADSAFHPCSIAILTSVPKKKSQSPDRALDLEASVADAGNYMEALEKSPFMKRLMVKVQAPIKVIQAETDFENEENWEKILVVWQHSFQGLERDVVIFLPCDPFRGPAETQRKQPERAAYPLTRQKFKALEEAEGSSSDEGAAGSASPVATTETQAADLAARSARQHAKGQQSPSRQTAAKGAGERSRDQQAAGEGSRERQATGERSRDQQAAGEGSRERQATGERSRERQATGQEAQKKGIAEKYWETADIRRYSPWDRENLFLSASACTVQLILLVP